MTLRLLLALLALVCVACGSEPAAPRCELGRSSACTCSSGAAGAQECGPSGVWSPCVCAAPDAATVDVAAVVDAPADVAPDVAQVDVVSDVAVVERDVPGVDVAVDASPAADAAVDAPPPIGDAPPALADRVERMQVWLSTNGAPAEYEPTGRCARTASGGLYVYTLPGTFTITAAGLPSGVTIQCPGAIEDGLVATAPMRYTTSAGVPVVNGSFRSGISPPTTCRDSRVVVSSFEVRAFGCPLAP